MNLHSTQIDKTVALPRRQGDGRVFGVQFGDARRSLNIGDGPGARAYILQRDDNRGCLREAKPCE